MIKFIVYMNKSVFYILLFLVICSINGCKENVEISSNLNHESERRRIITENMDVIEEDLPLFITDYTERANPYTVANMTAALEMIRHELEHPCGLPNTINISDIAYSISIQPTDYYIALYPDNATDYDAWADTCLIATIPYSLLLENVDGCYGNDMIYLSDIEQEVPVLYGTCSADSLEQIILSGVNFNIIENLFIPENSAQLPDYRQWFNDPSSPELFVMDELTREQRDFAEAITNVAFRLAGYETEDVGPLEETECVTKYFLWWSWTDCDTYHHPTGQITIETPNGTSGVSGIKVRLFRWFIVHDVYTDGSGLYYDQGRWKQLWLTDNIAYTIKTEGKRFSSNNQWKIKTSIIQGALPLWTYSCCCGFQSSSGYSVYIDDSAGKLWGRCVINNAIYDYCVYAETEHLTLPPSYLDIASSNGDANGWISSCPLLKNHLNLSLMDISYIGPFLELMYVCVLPVIYPILPDLILKYGSDITTYNDATTLIWHELTHSSHYRRTLSTTDIYTASYYWSGVVSYEAEHYVNEHNPYGSVGYNGWEQIALAEGWANYREWYMGNIYLNYNNGEQNYFGNSHYVEYYYSFYYSDLYNHGVDMNEIEQALANAYTLTDFKLNLLAICPQKSEIINSCLP